MFSCDQMLTKLTLEHMPLGGKFKLVYEHFFSVLAMILMKITRTGHIPYKYCGVGRPVVRVAA